jgi:membrane-bound lytic murein transglycosylase A
MADLTLTKVNYKQLPGWQADQQQLALPALQSSCKVILNKIRYDQWDNTPNNRAWRQSCSAIMDVPSDASTQLTRSTLQKWFTPYLVADGKNSTGLFTGYYNPTIAGSLTQTPYYSVPIYARPRDLVKIDLGKVNPSLAGHYGYRLKTTNGYQLLPTRAEIAAGVPLPNTEVLAWVHSEVDRFFMQIQGSGSIQLADGSLLLLGYDGQNGRSYYPIGKHLIETGAIPKNQVSMQAICAWLEAHPTQAQAVLELDPSFVFFKKLSTQQPLGSMGLPLLPSRSLAVDADYITLGLPLWVSTYLPELNQKNIQHGATWQHLMVAQDTGGAIQGVVRGDIFWGSGAQAQWLAGHMQSSGQYWVLLPKNASGTHLP